MRSGAYNSIATFQVTNDKVTWNDCYSCRAYINGASGRDFFIANAGFDCSLAVEISCRYDKALMSVIPTTHRVVDHEGNIYELISPADDIKAEHKEIKFRAKKVFS